MLKSASDPPFLRQKKGNASSLIHLLIIAAAVISVYLNAVNNGFVGDDAGFVVDNTAITSLKNAPDFFVSPRTTATRYPEWGTVIYRPLRTLSYAVDYFLYGLDSRGYHITNIILHLCVCTVLYFLIALVSGRPLAAFAGALVFAVHPLHVEAVAWIASRADLLGTLFLGLSLLCYIMYRDRDSGTLLASSLIFSVLAYFSKETMVPLPGIIILYDCAVKDRAAFKDMLKSRFPVWMLFALLCFTYLVLRFSITGRMSTEQDWWGGSFYSNFLMMAKATAVYLRLLVWPFKFNLHYTIEPVRSLFDIRTFASIAVILLTIAMTAWFYRKNRLVFFFLAVFYLALVPIANIVPISFSMMAERYIYMASLGPIAAAGIGIDFLYHRLKDSGRLLVPVTLLGALVLAAFSLQVILRNRIYLDQFTFYQTAVEESPGSAPSHKGLADEYERKGDGLRAIAHYEKAVEIDPCYAEAFMNMAAVHIRTGARARALQNAEKALACKPDNALLRYSMGNILKEAGDLPGAKMQWEKAVRLNPDFSEAYNSLGNYYLLVLRDKDTAAEMYRYSLKANPDNAEAHYNLAQIFETLGDRSRAGFHYGRFIYTAGPEYRDFVNAVKSRYPSSGPPD